MAAQNTTIFIFSSITGIAQSLREADSTLPLQEIKNDALDGYGGTVEFNPTKLKKDTLIQLQQAEILISEPFVVSKLLEFDKDSLASLDWCMSTYAGIDPLFASKISFPLHFKLTRFAGCFGPPIAEWCIAHIIGHERGFKASAKDQLQKSWAGSKENILHYRYLSSVTLSILGCGDIGCSVAKAAKAFGMRTIGFGKKDRDEQSIDGIDEYTTNLKYALQSADYIVSVLPSTPDTRGLLNGKTLQQASSSNRGKCPVFLNVGRGDVISEENIVNALENEYISAAILDVFEVEPLPIDSPLWNRSDIVISPHVSGLTYTI